MALLRDSPRDLGDAVLEAAARIGIAARQVEKDYWVTEVLRELAAKFGGHFLFKGGTSLSKAYRLIQRFSEDVDLLLLSTPGAETDDLLDQMQAVAGTVCASVPTVGASTEGLARVVNIAYPTLPNTPKAPGMRKHIRLEPGVRGGPHPSETKVIRPLLAEVLGLDDTADTVAFDVQVLHPARTMIEKLFAVDAMAAKLLADAGRAVADTEARHYYDLFFLWDEALSPALAWLTEDDHLREVVVDCLTVSTKWYPEAPAKVPDGGLWRGPGFTDPGLAARIAPGYLRMLDAQCYPGAPRPSLDAVRARAAELADRINP